MTITLTYQPNESLSIDGTLLNWDTDRQIVRQLLNEPYATADTVFNFSENQDGDSSQTIIQRRDIYKNYKGLDNYFFLNYDKDDKLSEVEIHHGLNVRINGVLIDFSMSIDEAVNQLETISADKRLLSEGEYLFNKIKLMVASDSVMGSEGDNLAYIYFSKDIQHLADK